MPVPIPIPIPSSLLQLLLLLLLLSIIRSLLLISQHLRLSLLILARADRILHHHAAAMAAFHGGLFALAGADGADKAGGVVFLLFLFAGVGAGVEERGAGCAGDVHLLASGEVDRGLRGGEEAAGRVQVEVGAAGVRAAWRGGLLLLLVCCGWLIEVHAGAAGEWAARRSGLTAAEMHAGAARVRSAGRSGLLLLGCCGWLVEVHAGAARVRSAGRSALGRGHVRPVAGRGAREGRRSLGHGFSDLLDIEATRRSGALVCERRWVVLRRIVVWLGCHGGPLLHPLLRCQTLAMLVAG